MLFTEHPTATCPACDDLLYFGTKEEATGWKVYYECGCGWEHKAGWVPRSEIVHRDEVDDRAEAMGERWAGP